MRDFSHSSIRFVAVRLRLLGENWLTILGRSSSSLGERRGVSYPDDFFLLNKVSYCRTTNVKLNANNHLRGRVRRFSLVRSSRQIVQSTTANSRAAPTRRLRGRSRRLPIRPVIVVHRVESKRLPRERLVLRFGFTPCRHLGPSF